MPCILISTEKEGTYDFIATFHNIAETFECSHGKNGQNGFKAVQNIYFH